MIKKTRALASAKLQAPSFKRQATLDNGSGIM